MIKVINVVQDFNMGGIQSVLLNLLRAFKNDKDIDFSVVVLEKPYGSQFDKAAKEEHLNITYLGAERSKNSHYYIRKIQNHLSYNQRLKKFLKKQKPQIVHTHNTRMLKLIIDCIKSGKDKYVWFHTLHSDPYAVNEAHIPYIQRAVNEYGVHPVCLNATQFEKAKARYGIKECDYLYNIVDLERFCGTNKNREVCRKNLGIKNNNYVVGTVGRLDEVKNYLFLLEVFAETYKQNKTALLIFTGDGDQLPLLKEKAEKLGISKNVVFLGIRKDTENVYPAFDVFALTSLTESSAIVVLEAQAAELPCVVSAAVPKESVITDRVVIMPKASTPSDWARQMLTPDRFSPVISKAEDYGEQAVKEKIKKLYKTYIKE